MKLAKDIVKDLFENFELIDEQQHKIRAKLTEINKKLTVVAHKIETMAVTKDNAYEALLEYQVIAQERRYLKEELDALSKVKSFLPIEMNTNKQDYHNRKKGIIQLLEKYTNYDGEYFSNFIVDPETISV